MRAERLLNLLMLLQNRRRLTAAELAERLGVSVRTVQRDVDALSTAGIPVYAERGRGGGLRLDDGFTTRLTGLSAGEAEALSLIAAPVVLADLAIHQQFDSAVEKMTAAIPAIHRLRARHSRNRLMIDTLPWFHEASGEPRSEMLDALRQAVWNDTVCRVHYQRGDGLQKRYRLEPHALVAKVDVWYLVARSRGAWRVFRLSRILALDVTGEHFERQAELDLRSFWTRWCRRFESRPLSRYRVSLALTAPARDQLLERYGGWHAEALSHWRDDKPVNVVSLDLENETIAARVVFELAGSAWVLAPKALRRIIHSRARALLVRPAGG